MKLFRLAIIAISGVCAAFSAAFSVAFYAPDTIAVQSTHPLGNLAHELVQRYGYPVTYEEAPFDPSKLQTEILPNGTPFLGRPITSITFQMPGVTVGQPVPGQPNRVPAMLPDVVLPLLAQYQQPDGAKFSALFYNDYAHIIPTNRMVNGVAQPFEPVLSTMVTMKIPGTSCMTALNSLFAQVGAARGVRIVQAVVPISSLFGHQCVLNVSNYPARDMLASILDQAGTATRIPHTKTRFSWSLLYDPNTDKYFLSTSIVPNLDPKPAPVVAPMGATASTEPSRLVAPARP